MLSFKRPLHLFASLAFALGMSPPASAQQNPDAYQNCLGTCYQGAALATGYDPGVFMQRCSAECRDRYDNDGQGPPPNNGLEKVCNGIGSGKCYAV